MHRRLAPLALGTSAFLLLLTGPALADHNVTHTRQQICTAAGGQFSGPATETPNNNQQDNQRCTVRKAVDGPAVSSGAPTSTTGEPQPVGEAESVTTNLPVGEPTIEEETSDVGEPTSETVDVPGVPVVTEEERDAGEADVESVTVPSGPPSAEQETVRGQSTSTTAPGPPANCRRVNDGNARQPVQKCDRTEVTTTTTPTTIVTTTTTPMKTVTTTTQPRETVITTVTPFTPTTTTVQRRQTVTTTTQQTEDTTVTTQPTERTVTTSQPTTITTVTTTSVFSFSRPGNALVPVGTPTTSTSMRPGDPIVTNSTIVGDPIVTTETAPGDPTITPITTEAEPSIVITEGAVFTRTTEQVVTAEPEVVVTEAPADSTVVVTEAQGPAIVETQTRTTGSCVQNPGRGGDRANAC